MSAHLYVRSAYSLLQGTMRVERLVSLAKTLEFEAVALTDRYVMHGALEFIKACSIAKIKPILGLELDINIESQAYPFVVIAKNAKGYQHLLNFSSLVKAAERSLELSDFSDMEQDLAVVALSAESYFDEAFINNDLEDLRARVHHLKSKLPAIYVGLTHHEHAFYNKQNMHLIRIAQELKVKVVAMHKVLYGQADEDEPLRVLRAIDKQTLLSDTNLVKESFRYMLSKQELINLYPKESLDEVALMVESIEPYINENKTFLPKFETPSDISSAQYLTQLCLTGLSKRFDDQEIPASYKARLKMELDVICSMHFEDYFLIVWDFIRYAKKQEIYVGPGRGSAAGSLVSYSLGITHVDPLVYGLLFERFLNPERISLPDIDTDFPDTRRDEVIRYVFEKYGSQHVAHILTFGTLAAKQVLRDVGRVMEISVREMDAISKTIPATPKITLAVAYEQSTRFRQLIASDERYQKLYALASKLEGLPRHVSTHAAGIVMSSVALTQVVPLIRVEEGMLSTQYTMEYLEDLGLIKMDFLGLRNLSIIDEVVMAINAQSKEALNILKIPLDDEKTLTLVRDVDTVGIFQLESEGMKNLLRQMKTRRFEDIVATIALFRPGPMENIPEYIKARNQGSDYPILHENLRPIVDTTHGILIYQEQIMQVAQKMAGFSLARADVLRKAMSKKNAHELEKMRQDFIEGCQAQGYSQALGESLYTLIEKFANYGFNKSHSVAYAMISYQMAYLKANHTAMFMVALLNSVIGAERKTFEYIQECKAHHIHLLNPSINTSSERYTLQKEGIRFPLLIIKGIGGVVSRAIHLEQSKGGFENFYECVLRLSMHKISKNHFEALIDAGAFDEFNLSRSTMLASLPDALTYADMVKVEHHQQIHLDTSLVEPLPLIKVKDQSFERLEREKNVLGFYLSDHPLTHLKRSCDIQTDLVRIKASTKRITFLALVKKIKQHRTKNGALMAFVSVYDESGEFDCVLMPNVYDRIVDQLKLGVVLKIEGVVEKEQSCLVKDVEVIPYQ